MIYAIGWVVVGLTAYPRIFGYFQNSFPTIAEENYRADLTVSMLTCALLGPLSHPVSFWFTRWLALHGRQRWKWL